MALSTKNSGQVVSQDWTPWLTKAPDLINKLGCCIAMAATREISRIKLNSSELSSKDLASNLLDVANQGQNAFLEAYSDLLEIGTKTNAMGAKDGFFDQLEEMLEDPESERTSTRLLARLQSDIDTCNTNGKRTADEFMSWRKTVNRLQKALVQTQSGNEDAMGEIGDGMKALNDEIKMQEIIVKNTEFETRGAKENYERTLQVHRQREKKLMEYADHAVGCATFGCMPGMFGAILAAGVSGVLVGSSAEQAAQAEAELRRKREVARELDLSMKKVVLALDGLHTKEEKLKELAKIIIAVLNLLNGLSGDITSLLSYFKIMNDSIKRLVEEHKANQDTVRAIQDDVSAGANPNKWDYKQFRGQIYQMKRLSLTVNSLSTLYSTVITDIINPGFERVVEASHGDASGQSTSLVLVAKQASMNSYLKQAEEECKNKSLLANQMLNARLAEVDADAASAEKRGSRRRSSRSAAPSFRSSRSSEVGSEKSKGRFSRMFGR